MSCVKLPLPWKWMKSIFLILSLYQECNAHAEILSEINGALSKRWKDYFGIYLWVTIGVNMILSAFIIALSGLFLQYAVLTLVVTLIAGIGYAVVLDIMYLFIIKSTLKDIIAIVLGIVALKFGGDLAVDNAVKVATVLGLSEKIISVTILAIGTSLPELVTSVSAAAKGKSDIAIGNVLGSNIFNMLLIIGTSAAIKPIVYNVSYNKDMIILLVGTLVLALFPLIPPKNKMSRMNGIVYVLMYAGYMATLFFV